MGVGLNQEEKWEEDVLFVEAAVAASDEPNNENVSCNSTAELEFLGELREGTDTGMTCRTSRFKKQCDVNHLVLEIGARRER